MRTTLTALSLFAASCCIGCPGRMELPPNFVRLDKDQLGPYVVRGVSADGTVLGLRRFQNPTGGTLEFWGEAVKNELVTGRGYSLEAEEEVTSASNSPGKMLTFSARCRGAAGLYVVALFVTDRHVIVAEAGGKTDALKSRLPEIRKSLLSST